jgi:FAD/FMN-containing dehydrogenase
VADGRSAGQLARGDPHRHNLGKIHDVDVARFELRWYAPRQLGADGQMRGEPIRSETLDIPGPRFRKAGLGKDVTDKFLAGLPGRAEGGLRRPDHLGALGAAPDAQAHPHGVPRVLRPAQGRGALDRRDQELPRRPDPRRRRRRAPPRVLLAGLEHLDERYLRAVGYTTKSRRGGLPKMVLFGDIVGDDDDAVARATSEVVRLANGRSGEGFIAVSPEARKTFWLDRARTAAIARHTNAFKINEDVVIPLPRMGEYTDGIERINIELSTRNKLRLLDELDRAVRGRAAAGQDRRWRSQRRSPTNWWPSARARPRPDRLDVRARWQFLLDERSTRRWPRRANARQSVGLAVRAAAAGDAAAWRRPARATLFHLLQDRTIRVSWKTELRAPLARDLLQARRSAGARSVRRDPQAGAAQPRVRRAAHARRRRQRAHQHPGQLRRLRHAAGGRPAVARIMALARSLDGVISGEHGIGITKLEFLTDDEIRRVPRLQARVDPEGRFNKGKLLPGGDLRDAYTPSFGLMGAESLILQQSDIGSIADSVKDCLRCGKCKPVCATHVPRANLLYSRATRSSRPRC